LSLEPKFGPLPAAPGFHWKYPDCRWGFRFLLECDATLPRFSGATKAAGRLNARQCDDPRSRAADNRHAGAPIAINVPIMNIECHRLSARSRYDEQTSHGDESREAMIAPRRRLTSERLTGCA